MILKFKQKLCGNGLPMVDLNGDGYSEWDCFDGEIEYSIDFDVREYGVKDIIPFLTSFKVHLEEMDGLETKTIELSSQDDATLFIRSIHGGHEYSESWTQLGDAIVNGLNISHITLDTDERIIDVCMR